MRCQRCARPAEVTIRYSGSSLCADHFLDFFGSRVKKAIREQLAMPRGGARIAVAVSGGKDSLSVLQAIHGILGERRDVEIVSVTVDEGIAGYRASSLKLARDEARRLGVEHRVVRFRDAFGMPLDAMVARLDMNPCSICGVLRRRMLNDAARDAGADVLATGLNLDDTAQTVLMNLARGDTGRIQRMGPHRGRIEGLVPRIQPFLRIPEKETYLYAILTGLPIHGRECPYAVTAERLRYRNLVYALEDAMPGARHGLLRSFEQMRASGAGRTASLPKCSSCGEPGSSDPCTACAVLARLGGGRPGGPVGKPPRASIAAPSPASIAKPIKTPAVPGGAGRKRKASTGKRNQTPSAGKRK